MCLAIAVTEGHEVPIEYLIEGQANNPDGCGMAWVENGEIQIFKSMDFNEFYNVYAELIERLGLINMLIHFRITSRGSTTLENCHPFMINNDMCIIHNGTIANITVAEHGKDSDTKFLAEKILAEMPTGWYNNAACARLIEDFIGWSKMCLLTKDNEIYIYNESKGYWVDNIWYSNKTYESYKNYKASTFTSTKADKEHYKCDGCGKTTVWVDLTYYKNESLCSTCMCDYPTGNKFNSGNSSAFYNQYGKTKTYSPCGGCRTLTDKEEKWVVEVTFEESLEDNPEQLCIFQETLIEEVNLTTIHVSLCDKCYTWCSDLKQSGLKNIQVIALPVKFTQGNNKSLIVMD